MQEFQIDAKRSFVSLFVCVFFYFIYYLFICYFFIFLLRGSHQNLTFISTYIYLLLDEFDSSIWSVLFSWWDSKFDEKATSPTSFSEPTEDLDPLSLSKKEQYGVRIYEDADSMNNSFCSWVLSSFLHSLNCTFDTIHSTQLSTMQCTESKKCK